MLLLMFEFFNNMLLLRFGLLILSYRMGSFVRRVRWPQIARINTSLSVNTLTLVSTKKRAEHSFTQGFHWSWQSTEVVRLLYLEISRLWQSFWQYFRLVCVDFADDGALAKPRGGSGRLNFWTCHLFFEIYNELLSVTVHVTSVECKLKLCSGSAFSKSLKVCQIRSSLQSSRLITGGGRGAG